LAFIEQGHATQTFQIARSRQSGERIAFAGFDTEGVEGMYDRALTSRDGGVHKVEATALADNRTPTCYLFGPE
jgi:hypothetical protein